MFLYETSSTGLSSTEMSSTEITSTEMSSTGLSSTEYQYHKLSVKCDHLVAACLKVRIVGTPATDFCTYIERKGSNFWYGLSWTIPNNCITIPTFMLRYPNPPNFIGMK